MQNSFVIKTIKKTYRSPLRFVRVAVTFRLPRFVANGVHIKLHKQQTIHSAQTRRERKVCTKILVARRSHTTHVYWQPYYSYKNNKITPQAIEHYKLTNTRTNNFIHTSYTNNNLLFYTPKANFNCIAHRLTFSGITVHAL